MNELMEKNEFSEEMKEVIKDMYFPNSTDVEFQAFLMDAQAKGLDPLQKEIIPISFRGRTTTVVSRDGYVKKAKENPNFLGYRSQPIYENDEFEYEENNDGFHYSFKTKFGDRGKLIGAFCHVSMKEPYEDTFALVDYKEVRQNTPVWKTNPTFMTQKVAEVRALKPVSNLAGVCSDAELGQSVTNEEQVDEEIIDVEQVPQTPSSPKEYVMTSSEDIVKYFESFKKEEGFSEEEVISELDKLLDKDLISPEYYIELKDQARKIPEGTHLYKCEA